MEIHLSRDNETDITAPRIFQ